MIHSLIIHISNCGIFQLVKDSQDAGNAPSERYLLLILLDVADIVAAHCACPHVTDERKQLVLWPEGKQGGTSQLIVEMSHTNI